MDVEATRTEVYEEGRKIFTRIVTNLGGTPEKVMEGSTKSTQIGPADDSGDIERFQFAVQIDALGDEAWRPTRDEADQIISEELEKALDEVGRLKEISSTAQMYVAADILNGMIRGVVRWRVGH